MPKGQLDERAASQKENYHSNVIIAWCVRNKFKPRMAKGRVPVFNASVLQMIPNEMIEAKQRQNYVSRFLFHFLSAKLISNASPSQT